jgi:DnaJ-domain-containing protein 1
MTKKKTRNSLPDEIIINKIIIIRDKKIMIDTDLAELYGVTTKQLNQQVKRNRKRFPKDFMFQLTWKEKKWLIENNSSLSKLKFSANLPLAFTEHGAVMLASILNSERAIKVNIQIVRIFAQLREMILTHKDILLKLEQLEKLGVKNNEEIQYIFNVLKKLLQQHTEPRKRIGFKISGSE